MLLSRWSYWELERRFYCQYLNVSPGISVRTVLSWSITDKLPRPLWYQENLPRSLFTWMINNYLGLPFYPPCLKIDHCNRRVDCRISRILIKHTIQATKSMFGLSQSNLSCVVVFIPRLCMIAELLVPAPSPLCVVCPLRTAEVRGPLPVSRSRSAHFLCHSQG